MAIKIKRDYTKNSTPPLFVLATRNADKIGVIPAEEVNFRDPLNSYSEASFKVHKYLDGIKCPVWEDLTDFKLVWCKDWDMWFEAYVELNETDELVKNVSLKALGESELSQINLYNIQINTEDDIARDDYEPTVLYDDKHKNRSLLSRITEKAPHYKIKHVDLSIKSIQRTFSFDDRSILDAFNEISEEINCIFIIDCGTDSTNNIKREINVYDLESYCPQCGHRGEFLSKCPECGNVDILTGYGEDTSIFISSDNLSDDITYRTDVDSVKNCFKLEAGDDLMTAALSSCNPNGSGYIWYMSDELKADMSHELSKKLSQYDALYDNYQNQYEVTLPEDILNKYNNLITNEYTSFRNNNELSSTEEYDGMIPSSIIGYPNLMKSYYDTIDFEMFLKHSMMPSSSLMPDTTASAQVSKLTSANISPVSVTNISTMSVSTASSAVLSMAKVLVDSRYQVRIDSESMSGSSGTVIWTGSFVVTNYSDSNDTATSSSINVTINDDYTSFVKQKISKTLNNKNSGVYDIVDIFALDNNRFSLEIEKYCLESLKSFNDACGACLNVLIEQGATNNRSWGNKNTDDYKDISDLYNSYYDKSKIIAAEIKKRESDIAIVSGVFDSNGGLIKDGVQTIIERKVSNIQDKLNLEKFLGTALWKELASFRREDVYKNDNYISDGLNNAELFDKALEFIKNAKKDIYKSATLQHSISASLSNLLMIPEFEPIVDKFALGNWLRIRVDGKVYRLRLIEYELNFSNLLNISVTFSDVKSAVDGATDIENILDQASSMATSYNFVARQASKGNSGNSKLIDWVNKGLALTKMKIVDDADNQNIQWDSNGILCREYLPVTDTYDDKQLKIINRGLYLTDDNWESSKAGIGDFVFYNPKANNGNGEWQEAYGVIADTLVGNLILSEEVGIYNTEGSVTIDKNGVIITTDPSATEDNKVLFEIRKKTGADSYNKIIYFDDNGDACFKGRIAAKELYIGGDIGDETSDTSIDNYLDNKIDSTMSKHDFTQDIINAVGDRIDGKSTIFYDNTQPAESMSENDIWFNTSEKKTYRYDGEQWVEITDVILDKALSEIGTVEATLDKKIQTYAQNTDPQQDPNIKLSIGDLWIDTTVDSSTGQPANTLKRWNGTTWTSIGDYRLDYLIDTVDGEKTIFYSDTSPQNPSANDLWFNTSDNILRTYRTDLFWKLETNQSARNFISCIKEFCFDLNKKSVVLLRFSSVMPASDGATVNDLWYYDNDNKNPRLRVFDGSNWVQNDAVRQPTIEDSRYFKGVEKRKLYFMSEDPLGENYTINRYDIWYNINTDEIKVYYSGWFIIEDKSLDLVFKELGLSESAKLAQATADGKISTYYCPDEPVEMSEKDVGDLWIDSDTNVLYRWTGSEWKSVRDKGLCELVDLNDGLLTVFYQETLPENPNENDIWYNTSSNDVVSNTYGTFPSKTIWKYSKQSDKWVDVTNNNLLSTMCDIVELNQSNDSRANIYAQLNDPSNTEGITLDVGDLWVNLNDNTTSYWNGDKWVKTTIDLTETKNQIDTLGGRLDDLDGKVQDANSKLDEYKTSFENYQRDLNQYITFNEDDGLILGAKSSDFKTQIDNQRLTFKYGSGILAYISNEEINISNATIENSLRLGNFLFAPHKDSSGLNDGGFSIKYV